MKTLDKIIKVCYLIGFMLIMTITGLMTYILTMLLLMYTTLRGQSDFMTEFKIVTKSYVEKIKEYLCRLGV